MGSLLDGIETSSSGQKAAKAAADSLDSAKKVKISIAVACLLIGGALIAWNLGVFGGNDLSTPTPAALNNDSSAPAPVPLPPQRPTAVPATGAQPPVRP